MILSDFLRTEGIFIARPRDHSWEGMLTYSYCFIIKAEPLSLYIRIYSVCQTGHHFFTNFMAFVRKCWYQHIKYNLKGTKNKTILTFVHAGVRGILICPIRQTYKQKIQCEIFTFLYTETHLDCLINVSSHLRQLRMPLH